MNKGNCINLIFQKLVLSPYTQQPQAQHLPSWSQKRTITQFDPIGEDSNQLLPAVILKQQHIELLHH